MRSSFPLSALMALASAAPYGPQTPLKNILENTDKSEKYTYPTDFTRNILPKPFHSHNDYWRDVPFYSGLSQGAISTEADVWLLNGTLYVGHEPAALTDRRTLESLYIQPILDTLHRQNPDTRFVQPGEQNGVFDTSSGQTLYFFIDIKTAVDETWPAVLAALEPLRSGNWLTTYDGKTLRKNPVTVIGTGNTQLSDVIASSPRDVFFDAPLAELNSTKYASLSANEAPIASTNFASSFGDVRKREFNDTQLATLRSQLDGAHDKGIMARYWNQPAYPVGTRNAVWRILWDEGVDLLNVDDLAGAAEFWEGTG
ncbi:hypothetical protein PtrSN002B_006657 [Pyrenophora tritici-repentis]|uniref:Uncharacterized protein n=3 Tax=Pyrenophora tritici-repentis TaxID=45151 RepID=A0A2W1FHJ3_9PLEO|nr:uncharacterized protein PTRG_10976 [Pyrenophora tritici-repentis Pt-1C-BFP]KAA8618156.1 hypothetical protein PtrV1_09663 [Pyrenophora tritici-repentis]EDU44026.1 conserved hypothetical protein [Pyrenophora tritici-repentis Pt-1C-BFP]KAF7568660.1 hypothetical protein PtrM4_132730 [Pyrenophora tritici-repentis]KAI0581065.1 hypothetical protein Alg215_04864 [Pyrenophora tritici-repentis]KAI0583423.1 hypothetical protein Alg130_05685 [Pyrenophora tritici-repentis]